MATQSKTKSASAKTQEESKEPEKRKFTDEELIPCVSITAGELFFTGDRSKQIYIWADIDDVIGVEYRDLLYAVRSRNKIMYKPRFIVQDRDFLDQHSELEEVYNGLYSASDLRNILTLPIDQMISSIKKLPPGSISAVKSLAMEGIERGKIDGIKRIKALDELFDTRMLMRMVSE